MRHHLSHYAAGPAAPPRSTGSYSAAHARTDGRRCAPLSSCTCTLLNTPRAAVAAGAPPPRRAALLRHGRPIRDGGQPAPANHSSDPIVGIQRTFIHSRYRHGLPGSGLLHTDTEGPASVLRGPTGLKTETPSCRWALAVPSLWPAAVGRVAT